MTARVCNYCNNPKCPLDEMQDVPEGSKRAWLRDQKASDMPCWMPFTQNIGKIHDEKGRGLVFENNNGSDYFIIAGNNELALLRIMGRGGYVIAHGLNWTYMSWDGGSYFAADDFEGAALAFLKEGGDTTAKEELLQKLYGALKGNEFDGAGNCKCCIGNRWHGHASWCEVGQALSYYRESLRERRGGNA